MLVTIPIGFGVAGALCALLPGGGGGACWVLGAVGKPAGNGALLVAGGIGLAIRWVLSSSIWRCRNSMSF